VETLLLRRTARLYNLAAKAVKSRRMLDTHTAQPYLWGLVVGSVVVSLVGRAV